MTASVIDDKFHITISPQTRRRCTMIDLGTLQHAAEISYKNNAHFITGWCSYTTFHPHSKLSVRIKIQNPKTCHSETHALVLTMITFISGPPTTTVGYILSSIVHRRTLDWTIVNTSEKQKVLIVFLV